MRIVILDLPSPCTTDADEMAPLRACGTVIAHRETTIVEFLSRAERADVLVTWGFPLRRELLDYATHPRVIAVPSGARNTLVETAIASQLGLSVIEFVEASEAPYRWVQDLAEKLTPDEPN